MGCCTWLNFQGVLAPFSLKCAGFLTVVEASEGESGLDSMLPPPASASVKRTIGSIMLLSWVI